MLYPVGRGTTRNRSYFGGEGDDKTIHTDENDLLPEDKNVLIVLIVLIVLNITLQYR